MNIKDIEAFAKAFAPVIKKFVEESQNAFKRELLETFAADQTAQKELLKSYTDTVVSDLKTIVSESERRRIEMGEEFEKAAERLSNEIKQAIDSISVPVGVEGAELVDEEGIFKRLSEKLESCLVEVKASQSLSIEAVEQAVGNVEKAIETVNLKLSEIPVPKNGKDAEPVDMEAVRELVSVEVKEEVAKIPPAKNGEDGKSVSMEVVEQLVKAHVDAFVKSVELPKDGKAGEDGRDALQLEILPEIDADKSYSRNTYAKHSGGLWRAFERTHGMRGWECLVNGVAEAEVKQCGDRDFEFALTLSDGQHVAKNFKLPAMIYKNVYTPGEYDKGDVVTFAGSAWHSQIDKNTSKPGDNNSDWKLIVKKGRDYKEPVKREPVDISKGVKI